MWFRKKSHDAASPPAAENALAREIFQRMQAAVVTPEAWNRECAAIQGAFDGADERTRLAVLRSLMRASGEAGRELRARAGSNKSISSDELGYRKVMVFNPLVEEALTKALAWEESDLSALIEWWRCGHFADYWQRSVSKKLLRCFEKLDVLKDPGVEGWIREAVEFEKRQHKPDAAWMMRALEILGESPELELIDGEPWSDALINDLNEMPDDVRAAWTELLLHAAATSGSAPTKVWAARAKQCVEAVGQDEFARRVSVWFALVDEPRTKRSALAQWRVYPEGTLILTDPGQELLKGLCWTAGVVGDASLCRVLGRLVLSAYRKVPGMGPRAIKVGNAALHALSCIEGEDALGQLAMLRVKVKIASAAKALEKALTAAARHAGMSREDVEELGVPAYGFTDVGLRRETLGEFVAELELDISGRATQRFVKPDGKSAKSAPAALKEAHAEELADLKVAAKDAASMLSAQRDRIDSLFLEDKTWPFAAWRERYLDHPLTGVIARALIWSIADETGRGARAVMFQPGSGFIDAHAKPVEVVEGAASVRLWHPIEAPVDEVLAWRRFCEERGLRQPFKQAHREVYVLTDAERQTRTYSNRFAAHVLRQHQFNALCAARGWKNSLRMLVDAEYPPATRHLPRAGLRAEFWVEGAGTEYGRDTNESGAFLYLTTDQVRFYRETAGANRAHASGGGYVPPRRTTENDQPIALDTVPARVLSEILRDVDLFVGVASVGNNPEWQDGGPENRFHDYWWSFGFGDLTETGNGRRELLERLVPRLSIASVCSFKDRFLVVQGKLRAYKIHLGSGNILMEPNDRYLCIVPGASSVSESTSSIHLPFEGDRTLSIILSKAFLLAADDEIKDPSITSQIRG